jgi:uncharacterized protein YoxC
MKAVGSSLGVLGDIQAVSTAIIMLAMVLILAAVVLAAIQVRRAQHKLVESMERMYSDLKPFVSEVAPLVHLATSIAENVNAISAVVRRDVDRVGATVADADARVRRAISATEAKIQELNALLAVAQEEAEDLFVSTASTLRGVRTGAAHFSQRDGPDLASDELDPANPADDTEISEEPNGDDDSSEPPTTSLAAAPRIRPRIGSRRRA